MEDGLPFSPAEPRGIVFSFFHPKLAIYRTTPVLGTSHLFFFFFLHFNMSILAEAMGSAGRKRGIEPEQTESRVESNLETNLATITTRI